MPATTVGVPAELDLAGITALTRGISEATGRVLVLEGADGIFCRGMSLAGHSPAGERADAARAFAHCLHALRTCPLPTIAVVDGEALGGGVGIAAACDLVLATPRAGFGLPELLFGLVPAIVLPVVTERISPQRARLLALRAHSIPAARAVELGLADELVPAGKLASTLARSVRELSRVDPAAVGELKRHTAPDLHAGAEVTAAALADPALDRKLRAFTVEGAAPWT